MTSFFLAQLLGLYFVIFGGIVLIRRASIMPVIADLATNKALLFSLAILELVAGIAIVLAYPAISLSWLGIISLIGWMLLVEGILYLSMPFRKVQKFLRIFKTENWYLAGGIISMALGSYLLLGGFQII